MASRARLPFLLGIVRVVRAPGRQAPQWSVSRSRELRRKKKSPTFDPPSAQATVSSTARLMRSKSVATVHQTNRSRISPWGSRVSSIRLLPSRGFRDPVLTFCFLCAVYMFVRTAIAFGLHYNKQEQPLGGFSMYYPLKLAAWEISLDYFFVSPRLLLFPCSATFFFFSLFFPGPAHSPFFRLGQYCYHRLTHENDYLWSIHSAHHTTKHPTPILSSASLDPCQKTIAFANGEH